MAENLPGSPEIFETVGFRLGAYDGGLRPFSYWGDEIRPGVHCPDCGGILDHTGVSNEVKIRGKWDVAWAHGRIIISERFRAFCAGNGYRNVEFLLVNKKNRLFEMRPRRILHVDVDRSQPLLRGFCVRCGNFDCYLAGRGLFFLDVAEPLADGIFRTDLIFGCSIAKSPAIIVGIETKKKIEAEKFRRPSFRPVPYVNSNFEARKAESLEAEILELQRVRALPELSRKDSI